MKDPREGEWTYLATEVTDKNGRLTYTIPRDRALNYGMYPVKLVVRYYYYYYLIFLFLLICAICILFYCNLNINCN